MNTKEKHQALKELNRMVAEYAEMHGIDVFMSASISERKESHTEQVCCLCALGTPAYLSMALASALARDKKAHSILYQAAEYMSEVNFNEINAN